MFAWLTDDHVSVLPDPVEASLLMLDVQLKHYVAAVRSGDGPRAVAGALSLQRECARLADWAQLAGHHHDKQANRALCAGETAQRRERCIAPRPTDAAQRAASREVNHG